MGDTARRVVSGVGQTLITLGVVVLLFCVYELWVTGLYTGRQQQALAEELTRSWERPEPAAVTQPAPTDVPRASPSPSPTPSPTAAPIEVPRGDPWAVLRVPALGRDWAKVVVEGVTVQDLKKGPGHWPGSPDPGQIGNVVLSGHRTTYGAPFNELDALQPGDALVLETGEGWFTYRLEETRIVAPTQVEVAYPVPGEQGATPTRALLTLTTCHPEYSAQQRMVLHAVLDETVLKSSGRTPAALAA